MDESNEAVFGEPLHTTDLNDGYEWGRLNLQSVTEQSNLDDFLATAELAGTEFTAEKLNVKFIDPNKNSGLLSHTEQANVECLQEQHKDLLRIPRRPPWDINTSPEELDRREKASFLDWRKSLSVLSEVEGIILTPYEKNLDFWRQLWRVIERSDIVVQIVDARNPLLFYCEDVAAYVQEVNPEKVNFLLVNKADLLTPEQRQMWCDYFNARNIKLAFWSALAETERQKEEIDEDSSDDNNSDADESDEDDENMSDENDEDEVMNEVDEDDKDTNQEKEMSHDMSHDIQERLQGASVTDSDHKLSSDSKSEDINSKSQKSGTDYSDDASADDCSHRDQHDVLNGEELLKMLRTLHSSTKATPDQTTVGMIGYPNVGKSSTINAILKMKKVPVSATPGKFYINTINAILLMKKAPVSATPGRTKHFQMKNVPVSATPGRTKHFQTLFVEKDLMLCDCPGLVFPSFVSTKAELVVNGILPIDQMRDHIPPVSLVCHYIPRNIMEEMYGINLPLPGEGEEPGRDPTAYELLNTYGTMRGFMTSNGLPDCPRTSRYILKDYVKGKLLYCKNPPGTDPEEFQCACTVIPEDKKKTVSAMILASAPKQSRLDREFFKRYSQHKAHSMGVTGVSNFARVQGVTQISSDSNIASPSSSSSSVQTLNEKPWKKHNNTKKREKLRRVYKDHDDD
ncbi:LSG1 [Mytilus edulis]|uniref:Large subunit GTPase 1 homolog n=1 Tax=Mytilus edulis TaxID=6550 RepID=A0A8S3S662_MYTED|nr:LSG1 [Mytilus edulis]